MYRKFIVRGALLGTLIGVLVFPFAFGESIVEVVQKGYLLKVVFGFPVVLSYCTAGGAIGGAILAFLWTYRKTALIFGTNGGVLGVLMLPIFVRYGWYDPLVPFDLIIKLLPYVGIPALSCAIGGAIVAFLWTKFTERKIIAGGAFAGIVLAIVLLGSTAYFDDVDNYALSLVLAFLFFPIYMLISTFIGAALGSVISIIWSLISTLNDRQADKLPEKSKRKNDYKKRKSIQIRGHNIHR